MLIESIPDNALFAGIVLSIALPPMIIGAIALIEMERNR